MNRLGLFRFTESDGVLKLNDQIYCFPVLRRVRDRFPSHARMDWSLGGGIYALDHDARRRVSGAIFDSIHGGDVDMLDRFLLLLGGGFIFHGGKHFTGGISHFTVSKNV
jgi:hypothetical protein